MKDYEKRSYQRGSHFHVDVKISKDQKKWTKAKINNLSSGGLQLCSERQYNVGEELWFDLLIQGFFSEFEIKVKGQIRNEKYTGEQYLYGVIFIGLSQDKKILIDENVKNDRPVVGEPYSLE